MNNRHIYLLAAALTVISLSLFFYKARVLGFPIMPQEQRQVWNVEAAVTFEPGPAAVKATLRIPSLTPGFAVLDENFVSRGFGLSTRLSSAGREAQWTLIGEPDEVTARLAGAGATVRDVTPLTLEESALAFLAEEGSR